MITPHQAFQEANERNENLMQRRRVIVSISTAIIAVLAAVATLFAHHRSISAISTKNEAILMEERATDQYSYYEAKRVRYTIYSALVSAGVAHDAKKRASLESVAQREQTSSLPVLEKARALETESLQDQKHAEVTLKSFETLEIGSTLFEISIVLVSISALAQMRGLFFVGASASVAGLGVLIFGLLQAH